MSATYDLPDELRVEVDGAIRTVVMNRPDALNAVDLRLHWALANVWRQIAADREARVVILTGAGRAFSAGGDLDWISTFVDDHAARDESLREGAEIIDELIRFPLPIVTAVNGPAVGLAFSIALLTDVVLVADDAHMADPHVSVGLVAADGGALTWPALTSLVRAKEYLFTGDRIPAEQAVQLGLANRVVPDGESVDAAIELAERMAKQPRQALRDTKRALNKQLERAVLEVLDFAVAAEAISSASDEHRAIVERMRKKA